MGRVFYFLYFTLISTEILSLSILFSTVGADVSNVSAAFSDDLNNTVQLSPPPTIIPVNEIQDATCTVHKDEVELTSDNYPNPYPHEQSKTWCFEFPSAIGIEIETIDMDVDPQNDHLSFSKGKPEEAGTALLYTGNERQDFEIIDDNSVTIKFESKNTEEHTFKGFKLKLIPVVQTTTEAPPTQPPTPPPKSLATIFKSLIVSKEDQTNPDTWNVTIRGILVESTNEWLAKHELTETLQKCTFNDVVLESVEPCPTSWPDNDQCARLQFGISLNRTEDEFDSAVTANPNAVNGGIELGERELSKKNLEKIWIEFAVAKLADAGILEYKLPNASITILIWTSVSLFVIGVFIGVLYGIWRMDFFKDYRRMSEDFGDTSSKRDSKLDLSMYPAPNQIVPPFLSGEDDPETTVFTRAKNKGPEKRIVSGVTFAEIVDFNEPSNYAYDNPFANEIEASERRT